MVKRSITKYAQACSIILPVLLALTLVNLVLAYRTPEYKVYTVNNYRVEHVVEVSYNASVKPSLLYGNKSTVGNNEPLYTRLIKELNICFLYNTKSDPPALSNNYKTSPVATLKSEGWEKALNLSKTLRRDDQEESLIACVNINFTKVLRDITIIEKEIGVRQDKHNVTIRMDTSIETILPDRTLRTRMAPTVILQINDDGRTYVITKGLRDVKEDSTLMKSPTTVNVMGFIVPTTSARATLLPLTIILGVATATSIGLLLRRGTEEKRDLEEILRERLKGKLIKGTVDSTSTIEVTLHDVEDFISVANEHRSDVIYDQSSGKYYVVDLGTIYSLDSGNSQLRKHRDFRKTT